MKTKFSIILFFLGAFQFLNAQQEAYLNSSLGFTYKSQVQDQMFISLAIPMLSFSSQRTEGAQGNVFDERRKFLTGIGTGLEFRKPISEQLSFIHGPNLQFNLEVENGNKSGIFRIPYTLGFLFNVENRLLIGSQIYPNFFYRTALSDGNFKDYGFSLMNLTGLISIGMRF